MDVYYAQKIAKYVQNPEVGVRICPNFEARCKRTSKLGALTRLSPASYAKTLIFGKFSEN